MKFIIGARVKTRCGSRENPYYEYGTITDIINDGDGGTLYKVEWDNGGFDYQYDFELEEAFA